LLLLPQPLTQLHSTQVGGVSQKVQAVLSRCGGQAGHQNHIGAGQAARQHLAVVVALLAQGHQPRAVLLLARNHSYHAIGACKQEGGTSEHVLPPTDQPSPAGFRAYVAMATAAAVPTHLVC
jgi:hypothetical protein